MIRSLAFALTALAAVPLAARAACPSDQEVAAYVAQFVQRTPSQGLTAVQSMEDALCAQAKVTGQLSSQLGTVVGYKAALTNPAMQARFGVDEPVHGRLLKHMLLPDGAELPASFGARPLWEADLLVVVKDAGLHRARSVREAAESISHIIPFMELPDTMLDERVKFTAPALVAINTGARYGVIGKRIPMQTDDAYVDSLASMTVVLSEDGKELARGPGSAIMGHPLNSAIWLARALERNGVRLKPGDVLSLGSFLPLQPPRSGTSVTVQYIGLPGDPSVGARFR